MPRKSKPLTVKEVENAKLEGDAKVKKLYDTGGLHLRINQSGKYWIFEYDVPGSRVDPSERTGKVKRKTKRNNLSLGACPDISLSEARALRDAMIEQVKKGIDPSQTRKTEKLAKLERASQSFELVALQWHEQKAGEWTPDYHAQVLRILKQHLFPVIGYRPIIDINAPELLRALDGLVQRGALETAKRARSDAQAIWAFAIAKGYATRNVAADLRGILPSSKVKHHATITDPAKVGELMRAIAAYEGSLVVKCALRLLPYVFTRPGELRGMPWREVDLDAALWVIPAARMKMREDHIVPLSTQAIQILREVQALTGGGELVFPGELSRARPISDNTINAALRRLGYSKDDMTAHGFRAMARTLLDEALGFRVDFIEQQLAHTVKDPLGRAYNRTRHLEERKRMMQGWSDYLDGLRDGTAAGAGDNVVTFRKNA